MAELIAIDKIKVVKRYLEGLANKTGTQIDVLDFLLQKVKVMMK
ncbi:hypothetical protein QFZ77_004590 [Paenibacillus sp. V4I3]|nr:hypothetical protein [Paenibacillus sp. V4I3]MDQ0875931.1 hypothetical protein [Paenibacillus sp. V4I3]